MHASSFATGVSDLNGQLLFSQNYGGVVRDVALDPVQGALFIADEKRDTVTVFDSNRNMTVRRLDTPVPGGSPVIAYDGANDRLYFTSREVAPAPVMFIDHPFAGGPPVQVANTNFPVFDLTVDDAGTVFWVSNNAVFRKRTNELEPVKLFETAPSDRLRCVEADAQSGHVFVGRSGPNSMLTTYTANGMPIAQRPVAIGGICGISFYPALL